MNLKSSKSVARPSSAIRSAKSRPHRPPRYGLDPLEPRVLLSSSNPYLYLPFQAANYSTSPAAYGEAATANVRELDYLNPTISSIPYQIVGTADYESSGYGVVSFHLPTQYWSADNYYQSAANFDITIQIVAESPGTTLDQALSDASGGAESPSAATMDYDITGGGLDGKTITLQGESAMSDNSTTYGDSALLTYAFYWGTDQTGQPNFLTIKIDDNCVAEGLPSDDSDAPSLAQLIGLIAPYPDPTSYDQAVLNQFQSDAANGTMCLSGAIPDLLCLYDFSGAATASPQNINYHDQFDDGVGASSSGVAGGAACGPSSLDMALQVLGTDPGVQAIYDASFTANHQIESVMNDDNNFDMWAAHDWMLSSDFSTAYGATVRSTVTSSDTWTNVDSNLSAGRPVLLSTLLSVKAYPKTGGGHVILLLGVGQNPTIEAAMQQLYPDDPDGDYYIVADPAGDYFANAGTAGLVGITAGAAGHYGQQAPLSALATGINYGGFFAVYPAAELHSMAKITSTGGLQTLTLKATPAQQISGAQGAAAYTVHCPVNILITAPNGLQTGFLADGSFVNQIPGARYDVESDDLDENTVSGVTDPTEDVVVPSPAGGNYQVQLFGTASGSYTFDYQNFAADGTIGTPITYTGTATPGSTATYAMSQSAPSFAVVNGRALTVTGTSGNDVITLQADGSGNMTATLNGVTSQSIPLSSVTSIDVEAGAGNDMVTIESSMPATLGVSVQGGPGDDTIMGGPGNDTLGGGAGNDSISGGPGDDSIKGGAGADILCGGKGNDTIFGSLGNDTLRGGLGDDSLNGGAGTNQLYGGQGNNIFYAVNGTADQIFAGAATNDSLIYGSSDDYIIESGTIPPGNVTLA